VSVVLILLATAFAASIGAHYTGACMGMPNALRAIGPTTSLLIMAPLAFLGAALASHPVVRTVAHGLTDRPLGTSAQITVLVVAFGLTIGFTRLRIPTSTIQILVFAVAGVALADHDHIHFATIRSLVIVWLIAPACCLVLGYALTHAADRLVDVRRERAHSGRDRAGVALVVVGAAASFVMGSNDVANATGSLVAARVMSPWHSGVVGGAALAVGIIIWGRPLLKRVAFDIVALDRPMAIAAQAVQAVVVITAVGFGYFTSMNQALIAAMVGAGFARGRHTVDAAVVKSVVRGWLIGPVTAIVAAIALGSAVSAVARL
jgi:inorganic phosphate transporter, PiT family